MKFDIQKFSSKYIVKSLLKEDISEVYSLCKANVQYYEYMKMEPNIENLTECLNALPPNKTQDDKFFVGFYKEEKLVAFLDLIAGYPDIDTAYIGWFMVNREFQGQKIGTEIIQELFDFLKEENFRYIELGCIKGNKEAEGFWSKNGFHFFGSEVEEEHYIIRRMKREIGD